MKIKATDPDIFSICNRIEKKVIDLKPEFQRGDVWGLSKKKLLIDSIMRDWQVPPIHVVRVGDVQEVLDGQQRLRALYDFYKGKFAINGKVEPYNEEIFNLDGKKYDDLPNHMQMQFDHYSIRIFEITDYLTGEPGELFNRLNNALNLTSAEKRNAYVGEVTSQAKGLVNELELLGLDKEFLGFSNNRMAYDDLLIKISFMLESEGLSTKVTDKSLSDRYKLDKKFSSVIYNAILESITILSEIKRECLVDNITVHVTKATAFSWIYFISKLVISNKQKIDKKGIINTFKVFEGERAKFRSGNKIENINELPLDQYSLELIFDLYNERASSKVMTHQSMLVREVIIFLFYYHLSINTTNKKFLGSGVVDEIIGFFSEDTIDKKYLLTEYMSGLSEVKFDEKC